MACFSLVRALRVVFPLALLSSAVACAGPSNADVEADEPTLEDLSEGADEPGIAAKKAPAQPWVLDVAGPANENVSSVVVDGGGHVYVAGTFADTLDLGGDALSSPRHSQIYLAKFSRDGKHLFSKTFPSFDAISPSLALDDDGNVLLSGVYAYDISFDGASLTWDDDEYDYAGFVAKFDEDGNHLWSKNLGTHVWAAFTFPTVGADESGNVYVTGVFKGPFDHGAGPVQTAYWGDMFLLELDPNGNHVWSKHFGPDIRPTAISVNKSGGVAIGGYYYSPIDIGGGLMPRYADDWGQNGFIARFDGEGDVLWTKAVTRQGYANEDVMGVGFDPQGDVVATGIFEVSLDLGGGPLPSAGYSPDLFLAKFDGDSGTHLWSKSFIGNWDQVPFALSIGRDGDIALAGRAGGAFSFGGPVLGDDEDWGDAFVAKLDPEGNHLYSTAFPGPNPDIQGAYTVALDRDGNLVVGGSYGGSITVAGQTLSTIDWSDYNNGYVAKIIVP